METRRLKRGSVSYHLTFSAEEWSGKDSILLPLSKLSSLCLSSLQENRNDHTDILGWPEVPERISPVHRTHWAGLPTAFPATCCHFHSLELEEGIRNYLGRWLDSDD